MGGTEMSPRYPNIDPAQARTTPGLPVLWMEYNAQCPQMIPAGRRTSQAGIHPQRLRIHPQRLKASEQMASELVFRECGGTNPHC